MTEQPFLIPALLILIFSVPLVIGVVPRNRFYGIRTRTTLSDDAIWYPANRFGGWALTAACLVYLLMSALAPYDKSRPDNFSIWAAHLAAFVLPLAVGIIATLLYTRKIAESCRRKEREDE
jgi:uncharacterized membrane protein